MLLLNMPSMAVPVTIIIMIRTNCPFWRIIGRTLTKSSKNGLDSPFSSVSGGSRTRKKQERMQIAVIVPATQATKKYPSAPCSAPKFPTVMGVKSEMNSTAEAAPIMRLAARTVRSPESGVSRACSEL